MSFTTTISCSSRNRKLITKKIYNPLIHAQKKTCRLCDQSCVSRISGPDAVGWGQWGGGSGVGAEGWGGGLWGLPHL